MGYHDESTTAMDQEEDSPWIEDEENTATTTDSTISNQISQQEWSKLSQRYTDAGYREGILSGKQMELQTGFDQGYVLSSPYARELGTLRGITASLLSLLTTTAGAKHLNPIESILIQLGEEGKSNLILECRTLVTLFSKLDESDLVPIDLEAEAHVKEHEEEGMSFEMIQKKEMKKMEEKMSSLINGNNEKKVGLDECKIRLIQVLTLFGMESMVRGI